MKFKEDEVIWVPTRLLTNSKSTQYWPAQFSQMTNMPEICNVHLYDDDGLRLELFIVDVKDIKKFAEYQPQIKEEEMSPAFHMALREYENMKERESERIFSLVKFSTGKDFVKFVTECYIRLMLMLNERKKHPFEENQIDHSGELPTDEQSLILYLQEKIPQLLSYLLEASQNFVFNENDRQYLIEARDKIVELLSQMAKTRGYIPFLT